MDERLLRELVLPGTTRIVLLVLDGLGGLPHPATGCTELETAHCPQLDRLAREGSCGLTVPVGPGITPGSGPGHLALFGYDPLHYAIGRGVLEAAGIDFPLQPGDVSARGNFCTLDERGRVLDRRAGRIATAESTRLVDRLREIRVPDIEVFCEPVREHRFVLVLRAVGLSDQMTGTDPQHEGFPALAPRALAADAAPTVALVNRWLERAHAVLATEHPANGVLLRGFSRVPKLPSMQARYRLDAAVAASYPMYRGLGKLLGMTVLPPARHFAEALQLVAEHWAMHDFFFVHFKGTDTAGEDSDFAAKVAAIEQVDAALPMLLELRPDVLLVAGDHSTPATLGGHSWHPVPFLLHGPWVRPDQTATFGERACLRGALGTFPATEVLPLALAHAGRLARYGA
jgi:2,3-bisphosphoglycerate-independent phosphoglycerate mutase